MEKSTTQGLIRILEDYYPIKVAKSDPLYYESIQYKRYGSKILSAVHNDGKVLSSWKDLAQRLAKSLKKNVEVQAFGQEPSVRLKIDWLEESSDTHSFVQEVWVYQSLLCQCYTYAMDEVVKVSLESGKGSVVREIVRHVSLDHVSVDLVKLLESELILFNSGGTFVPYSIYSRNVPGLYVPYDDSTSNTIFEGLFYVYNEDVMIYGDENYRIENWRD